jgi:F-type H+-transporting ATPase subunit gamma
MASIKDLKKRIGTVKNTQQTTKAMKMVSAAKLRRSQEAIQSQRPYAKRIGSLMLDLSAGMEQQAINLLLKREKEVVAGETKKVLLVLVTSDRGLCGGFNGSIIKMGQRYVLPAVTRTAPLLPGCELSMAFVGRKGHDFFKTKGVKVTGYYSDLGGKVTFAKAKKLASTLLDLYASGEVDEVKFIYNEFKNAVTQKVVVEDFLPLQKSAEETNVGKTGKPAESASAQEYLVKPSLEEVIQELLSKHFAIQAFRIMLESQAGEHGARMSAMENATKNAGEMIQKLTLQYNKQRQAGITKELLEIISGSESQKG